MRFLVSHENYLGYSQVADNTGTSYASMNFSSFWWQSQELSQRKQSVLRLRCSTSYWLRNKTLKDIFPIYFYSYHFLDGVTAVSVLLVLFLLQTFNPPRESVSMVTHQAIIIVDEKGTEAAAATAISVMSYSMCLETLIEFTVDQPFAFSIHGPRHHTLFSGICQTA